jgi:hypothetical protein
MDSRAGQVLRSMDLICVSCDEKLVEEGIRIDRNQVACSAACWDRYMAVHAADAKDRLEHAMSLREDVLVDVTIMHPLCATVHFECCHIIESWHDERGRVVRIQNETTTADVPVIDVLDCRLRMS